MQNRRIINRLPYLIFLLLPLVLVNCAPKRAMAPQYVDTERSVAGVTGIGFESQDIKSMTDQMMRDLLANPLFGNAMTPPRVIIDDTRFVNESNQVINLNLLLDRLRIELMRASAGRMFFVSRQNIDLVQKEKELKSSGQVDSGARRSKDPLAGADYRLIGRIASQSTASNKSGVKSNYYQFSFEMLDLNNGMAVWGNLYDLRKAGSDDTIYR